MQSDVSFQNDPTGCNGDKPMGYDGKGQEIMTMSSPKPVLVQTFYAKGVDPTVMRKDLKAAFPIAGISTRTGGSTNTVQDTHSLIPGCGNSTFDWDGATARTGYVLTHTAEGAAPATKFKTGSFSLRAHDLEHCVATDFGAATGSCATT